MKFRSIDYGKMLLETLRSYYSVNALGKVNNFYKYMACLIQPLIPVFNDYATQRTLNGLIANCYWQIGQATNVLNYLYDNIEKRIFITQSSQNPVSATTFGYTATLQAGIFGEFPAQMRTFDDKADQNIVTIHIPNTVNVGEITATINQLILQGIAYQIVIE